MEDFHTDSMNHRASVAVAFLCDSVKRFPESRQAQADGLTR
jgi:hypothetical protein